ncbi:V8-like Glu-specific endopeptidase [Amycolatopsis arida]|uniref:V8-like Glu-specific endopeptidase n=1 Tax=Amycolatopsis arida TaxID=587909 RepID=A0A1I5R8G9_9PSEU|nr:serine protease [Amycolatopsis arida]TDX99120.1 V8-like Glu-specific endopeptidase [Amycolatopsis arida]SFP54838.1 V8-like Glu-specific endopeptidase [Amycolatopsis arida]
MIRRLLTLVVCVVAVPLGIAAPVAAAPGANFAGTVALSNCSGAVVRLAEAAADAPALVLTNGHCLEGGFPEPGEVVVDRPARRTFTLLSGDGTTLGTLHSRKVVYATMTGTDVALYQLDTSYADIRREHGVAALRLSAARPAAGTDITVVSGYWKRTYTCAVDGFVHELHEDRWVWLDSVRYTPECRTTGGTSGSPIVERRTGKVVGVNNTGNESGQRCTLNNPCEVAEDGTVTVRKGINYGQQTYRVAGCVTEHSEVDLGRADCHLPKPAAVPALTGA